jgi:hypothetical protein
MLKLIKDLNLTKGKNYDYFFQKRRTKEKHIIFANVCKLTFVFAKPEACEYYVLWLKWVLKNIGEKTDFSE